MERPNVTRSATVSSLKRGDGLPCISSKEQGTLAPELVRRQFCFCSLLSLSFADQLSTSFFSFSVVKNNVIGPSGESYGVGKIADGISLSCRGSTVQGNTIVRLVKTSIPLSPSYPHPCFEISQFDATDGAIVIFGSPGSDVSGNVISSVNVSRELLRFEKKTRRAHLLMSCLFSKTSFSVASTW